MFDLWARSLTSKKLMFQTLKTNLYKKAWLLTLGPGQAWLLTLGPGQARPLTSLQGWAKLLTSGQGYL